MSLEGLVPNWSWAYAPEDQLVLGEGAGFVTEHEPNLPEVLMESEVLNTCFLDIVDPSLVPIRHMEVVFDHARVGHLANLDRNQQRQRYQWVKEDEIGTILVACVLSRIIRLLFLEVDVCHPGTVILDEVIEATRHDTGETQNDHDVDEQQKVQLPLNDGGLEAVPALVQVDLGLKTAIEDQGSHVSTVPNYWAL
jgi:hypothetical protein